MRLEMKLSGADIKETLYFMVCQLKAPQKQKQL